MRDGCVVVWCGVVTVWCTYVVESFKIVVWLTRKQALVNSNNNNDNECLLQGINGDN